jgi:hypothetical protein
MNEQVWLVYFLCDKDMRESWDVLLNDDMPSIEKEQIMTLWQHLLQLGDNQLISVLFQYVEHSNVKTKVLLMTREDDELLVCNGVGSENLVSTTLHEMVDFLNWWSNLATCDIPATQVHPVYSKVFRCALNIKSIHLFTETHDMVNNTNLRLAQFNMICEAAQLRSQTKFSVL